MSNRASKAGALTVELVVVVVGVLIALAADSWWDARGDAQRAEAYLVALETDFSAAQADLDVAIAGYRRTAEQTGAFLEYIQAPERPAGDAPDPFAGEDVRFFPPVGTIDALLTTGDIALLPESVRIVLIRERAEFVSRTDQMNRFIDLWVASTRDIFLPNEEARFQGSLKADDLSEIARQSAQARTGWFQLYIAVENVLGEHMALKGSIDSVLQAVRAARDG